MNLLISLSLSTESNGFKLEDAEDVIYFKDIKNPASLKRAAVNQNTDNITEVNYTFNLLNDFIVTVDTLNAIVS